MAAPAYTEDLTDIDLAESDTGWATVNFSGGGGAALDFGPDLAMQGTNGVLRQVSGHDRGGVYNNGSTAGAVAAGVHIFQWLFTANPGLTDTRQNTGVCVIAGSATNALVRLHVEGNDTFGAAGRVGKCYAYRYNNTANGSEPYRTLTGSPGATPAVFGGSCNISVNTKGLNFGLDAVRYGTGAYITAGDSGDPATFDGFATQNDAIANRWGILTKVGNSYELQGRFVIGQNNGGTPTLAYFEDSDVGLQFVDTIHSETDFTQIIIDHASTVVDWTNVSLTALGTHNRGKFVVNNNSTSVSITGGTWTGIDTTELRALCAVDGLTWRGCNNIDRIGGDILNCRIESSTAAVALTLNNANALQFIQNCFFLSGGTGHAVDLGTVSSTQTISWLNTESGYAATNGSTGNETLLVNVASGQTLTINVADGASTPTYYNTGPGTVNVVAGQRTFSFSVNPAITGYEWRLYVKDPVTGIIGSTELAGEESATSSTQSPAYTYPYTADVDVVLQVIADGYEEFLGYYTLEDANQSRTANLQIETNT